jgi:hypothetical protein
MIVLVSILYLSRGRDRASASFAFRANNAEIIGERF